MHLVVHVTRANSIPEFLKRERVIIVRLQIIRFTLEVLVFSMISECLEFSAVGV